MIIKGQYNKQRYTLDRAITETLDHTWGDSGELERIRDVADNHAKMLAKIVERMTQSMNDSDAKEFVEELLNSHFKVLEACESVSVVYHKLGAPKGEVMFRCRSVEAAEAWIERRMAVDRAEVVAGRYSIDADEDSDDD